MTDDESPRVGDVIDKYEIDGVVGRGGMGAVFRARHALTGRPVALKWMLPDPRADVAAVQRFLREARAMGRIDHPNVVGVIDVGVGERSAYLVMELLRGSSLRAHIERERTFAPARAVSLLLPALEGVAAAHRAGVVHRDLKPENLMLVKRGRQADFVKILDFGIAKLHVNMAGRKTATGVIIGTPDYMAPEQAGGENIDGRTDLYSLGIIAYEMATGKTPFAGMPITAMLVAHLTQEPKAPHLINPNVPVAVFAIIGLYYYLRVVKVMYFDKPAEGSELRLQSDGSVRMVLSLNALGLLALGLYWGPLIAWCRSAFAG